MARLVGDAVGGLIQVDDNGIEGADDYAHEKHGKQAHHQYRDRSAHNKEKRPIAHLRYRDILQLFPGGAQFIRGRLGAAHQFFMYRHEFSGQHLHRLLPFPCLGQGD